MGKERIKIGNRVQFVHDNRKENGYNLYQNKGTVKNLFRKNGKEYAEVEFDDPIEPIEDSGGIHYYCYFCSVEHLAVIHDRNETGRVDSDELKRLTATINGFYHGAEGRSRETLTGNWCRGKFEATACVEELGCYEDAREKGRLFILPVTVGDTVWRCSLGAVPLRVVGIHIREDSEGGGSTHISFDVRGEDGTKHTYDIHHKVSDGSGDVKIMANEDGETPETVDYCDFVEYYDEIGVPVPYPYFFKQEYACKGHKEE